MLDGSSLFKSCGQFFMFWRLHGVYEAPGLINILSIVKDCIIGKSFEFVLSLLLSFSLRSL